MASIYVAERKGTGEVCVVKTLHDHLAKDSVVGNRFLREAQVASELRHPNIARLTDAKSEDGVFYLAMEFIAGHDLESMMFKLMEQRKMLPPELSVRVTLDVLEGLDYAHEYVDGDGRHLEIVHRDLSPRNVMITYDGEVKIIDFGLARTNLGEFRTAPGMVLGTLRYMSPEQAVAEPVDRRSDLYSWSIVLYEMLSGRPLVTGNNAQEVLHAVVTRMPPPLSSLNENLPPALDQVLLRGMSKDRGERFSTAREMARAIQEAAPELCRTKTHKIGRFVASVFPTERINADDLKRSISSEGLEGLGYEPTRAGQDELTAANVPTLAVELVPAVLSLDHPPEAPTVAYFAAPAPRRRMLFWALPLVAVASVVAMLATLLWPPAESRVTAVPMAAPREAPVKVEVHSTPRADPVVVVARESTPPLPPPARHRASPSPRSPPPSPAPRAAQSAEPESRYPWEAEVGSLMRAGREDEASKVLQDRAAALGARGSNAKSCAYDAVFWGRPLHPCIKMLREAEETKP